MRLNYGRKNIIIKDDAESRNEEIIMEDDAESWEENYHGG